MVDVVGAGKGMLNREWTRMDANGDVGHLCRRSV